MAAVLTHLERSWPNKVALPIPEGGFGWRFAFLLHAARDCGSRRHWLEGNALVFAFYDPADRARFRAWLADSAIDWGCPPEWPQVFPATPADASAASHAASRFDALAMEDWVRGAVHRGLARRVIRAYLARYRHDGQPSALTGAIDALVRERPDLDGPQLAARADAIIEWTRHHHRAWFSRRLAAIESDAERPQDD